MKPATMNPLVKAFYTDALSTFKVVECATLHISPKDDRLLKANVDSKPSEHPQVIVEYEQGYFVSAWHNFMDDPEDLEEKLLKIGHSHAYILILKAANVAGAKWVNFDCDGPTYDYFIDLSDEWIAAAKAGSLT